MASREFQISCPACETTLRPSLTEGGADAAADTLRGRGVTCWACDAEFEVLFYPR